MLKVHKSLSSDRLIKLLVGHNLVSLWFADVAARNRFYECVWCGIRGKTASDVDIVVIYNTSLSENKALILISYSIHIEPLH